MMELLLENKVDVNGVALGIKSIHVARGASIPLLLKYGADINEGIFLLSNELSGISILIMQENYWKMVQEQKGVYYTTQSRREALNW